MPTVLVLNGINLNMFGKRDPKQYGTITLAQIDEKLVALGNELGCDVVNYQTNFEGEMAQRIHQARIDNIDGVLINAGASKCICPTSMHAKSFAITRSWHPSQE